MGSVQSISLEEGLGNFFDTMYGDEVGWVYAPTKEPEPDGERFERYYFQWPQDREQLIEHCRNKSPEFEVYYGPSLFKSGSGRQEDFRGTFYVWCEFDGNAPDSIDGLPVPAIKVQSSESGNQHWYWRLDHFETDIQVVETISQRIAYHAGADLGCWNANRVLRPPGTRHHESGRATKVLRWDLSTTEVSAFSGLPEVPIKLLKSEDIRYVPDVLEVLMKFPFDREETALFRASEIPRGGRSDALAKMGHICIEKGMTTAEALSILLNTDMRWGKYARRKDQRDRLVGIINYARSKHPVDLAPNAETDGPLGERWKVYDYDEFISTEIEIDWAIEGFLSRGGFSICSGPPGVGKSQLSIRFGERLAKGDNFLIWPIKRPMKVIVFSMEMPHDELKYIMDQMKIESNELLRENFKIIPIGSGVRFNEKQNQDRFNRILDTVQPDGVIFDSLGLAINDDLSSDKIILETFQYIHETVRGTYGAFAWFIHHNRKAQGGNHKPNKLDDLYGSRYISAATSTALGLWPTGHGKPIEVDCLKLRFAKEWDRFHISRTPNLDFSVVKGGTVVASKTTKPLSDFGFLGDSI